ncbi:MAG TPA: branched-chain amino acid ABC transporter permease [Clostridia bacterium]|nr:branched-chain amino acid ABC transporter permease [Clostridia bacterium]
MSAIAGKSASAVSAKTPARVADGRLRILVYILILALLAVAVIWAQGSLDPYKRRVLSVGAINVTLAVGLNIIYGYTGQFSLGHAGFMAIGAYTSALLTMSPAQKAANFFIIPIHPLLANVRLPFLPAVLIGGLLAAVFAVLIGIPVLRLRDDYLGMATLGFSEIVRVLINNMQSITNGSLGLKGIPEYANMYWTFGWAAFSVIFAMRLAKTSFGRAFMAIREDDIAAEAVGIDLTHHKVEAFAIGAFFAGVGGALLGHWSSAVDPKMFTMAATFQVLTIVVAGGLGSITGTVIMAFAYAIAMEALRFIEAPMNLGIIRIPGIPGMRMVLFSVLLLVVILRFRQGLMGQRELSIDPILRRIWPRCVAEAPAEAPKGVRG